MAARMRHSTLCFDSPLATLATELEQIARGCADLPQLHRTGDAAEAALDELQRVLGTPHEDLTPAARRGFFAAVALVAVLDALLPRHREHADRLVRFGRTAARMLGMFAPLVGPTERAFATAVLPWPEAPELPRAQA